ncbi:MAG TPA: CoA transferase, partial [Stellaceae bacterium]|nr:CoA transferase [Stellaceae bacterium]
TMAAFALASALFQRERTGKGQRIDLAMLDVALVLLSSHMTGYSWNGHEPKPRGNTQPFATNGAYETADGLLMIAAGNLHQQRRLWRAVERPDMAKDDNEAREDDREREAEVLTAIFKTRTADEWERFLQARHVPAARVRRMAETLEDPHLASRGVIHRHAGAPGVEGPFAVPMAAFKFAHGGPSIETPPPQLGADTDSVLAELGYANAEIAALRRARVI